MKKNIFYYIENKDLDEVKHRVEKGESVDSIDKKTGVTATMLSASVNSVPILEWLVENDANYLYETEDGRTALSEATKTSSLETVDVLLTLDGINPRANCKIEGVTYLEYAQSIYDALRFVKITSNLQQQAMLIAGSLTVSMGQWKAKEE